jgi:hypothetical protein
MVQIHTLFFLEERVKVQIHIYSQLKESPIKAMKFQGDKSLVSKKV